MTAPVATRAPAALRVARALILGQATLAALGMLAALGFAALSRHDDLAARATGHPNDFDGLGVAVGLVFAAIFGVITLLLVIPAVGLCRGRWWGLVSAAVVEGGFVLVGVAAVTSTGSTLSLVFLAPAGVALMQVLRPECREWCRGRR